VTVIQRYGDVVPRRRRTRVGRWVRQGAAIVVIDPALERAPEPESGFELPEQTAPRPPATAVPRRPTDEVDTRLGTPRTVPDSRFNRYAPLDPQLVELARRYRLRRTDLSEKSFARNVAVIAYERDGRRRYAWAANNPGELHSESVALRRIERGDPLWLRTKIRGVYSERQPCSDCTRDLLGARKRLGARGIDFPVHYSVGQSERGRAAKLRARYAAGRLSSPHRR
jgi:hypothetical protein